MSKTKINFPDRISELVKIFGLDDLANYLDQDATVVGQWSNSGTLIEAPKDAHINYTYLVKKYNFNEQWLKEGIGEMFNDGSEEENIKKITDSRLQNRLEKDAIVITDGLQ